MKKAMQKTVLALVTGSLMGIVGMAQAAGPVSSIVTAKADIVFEATGTATAVITPKKGCWRGNILMHPLSRMPCLRRVWGCGLPLDAGDWGH